MNLHKCQTSKDEHGKPLGFAEMAAKKGRSAKYLCAGKWELSKKNRRGNAQPSPVFSLSLFLSEKHGRKSLYISSSERAVLPCFLRASPGLKVYRRVPHFPAQTPGNLHVTMTAQRVNAAFSTAPCRRRNTAISARFFFIGQVHV